MQQHRTMYVKPQQRKGKQHCACGCGQRKNPKRKYAPGCNDMTKRNGFGRPNYSRLRSATKRYTEETSRSNS